MTDSPREDPRPDRLPPHDTVLRRRLLDLLIYCAQQGKVANGTTGAMDLLESYDATVRALRVVPPEGGPRDNYVGIDNELEWRREQMAHWPRNQYGSLLTQGEYDALAAGGQPPSDGMPEKHSDYCLTERGYDSQAGRLPVCRCGSRRAVPRKEGE